MWNRKFWAVALICMGMITLWHALDGEVNMEEASSLEKTSPGMEKITLGGGCFWCLEPIFDDLKGVEDVKSGYSGGTVANPTYRQVCSGTTGHAEVIEITFDPAVLSLKELLEIFFVFHDPTTLNRQGADVGTQYRSVIFYRTPEQKSVAEQVMKQLQLKNIWPDPIVTELSPFKSFYVAEDYHQEYFKLNGTQPYCKFVIAPKVAKFRQQYQTKLKRHSP